MSDNEAGDGNIPLNAPPDKDADNAGGADDAKGGQIQENTDAKKKATDAKAQKSKDAAPDGKAPEKAHVDKQQQLAQDLKEMFDFEDHIDEKEYRIEPEEINDLFRASQSNQGGLCVQLTLSLASLMFILIDTIQIQGISGTLRAILFMTHEQYETYKIYQSHQEDEAAAAAAAAEETKDNTVTNPLVEEFYRTIEAEIEDHNKEYEEEKAYDNNSHRAGRVLAFLKTPTDFYDWFKYLLDDIYSEGPTEADLLNLHQGEIPEIHAYTNQTNKGKIMMDSSYIMGLRLQIYDSAQEVLPGNSAFAEIRGESRVHSTSYVEFDTIESHEADPAAFTGYSYNEGDEGHYVQYYPGSSTHEEAMTQYNYLKDNDIVGENMLAMDFEIMLYSNDARIGNVVTFQFHQTNAGLYRTHLDVQIFQPHNNGMQSEETFLRVALEGAFLICIFMVLFRTVMTCRMKCRSLLVYKLNEFTLQDMITLLTLCDGVAILVTGGYLLYSADFDYEANFHLPPENYAEYLKWVDNSKVLQQFQMLLGFFVIVQMINLLLIASGFLPSLGILFRTIEKSMKDIFVFTTIGALIFCIFVIVVYVSFGEHNYQFSTIQTSFLACFKMFLGDYPYDAMYKADPAVAALVLILFVFIMNFMMMNMYTAIVIRTYNKLQARQLFLGESMATILAKQAKKKSKHWFNLIACRSPFNKGKNDDADKNARRGLVIDEQEDRAKEQKFCQKLQQNAAKVLEQKQMTKDKFEKELKNAAFLVAQQKHKAKKERLLQLYGQNPAQSYGVLKNGIILLLHLIVSMSFYLEWSESEKHADLRSPIKSYIIDEKFGSEYKLDEIQSTYAEPIKRILAYDITSIGSHILVGNSIRVNFRLYNSMENKDSRSSKVFPTSKSSNQNLHSVAEKQEASELSLVKALLEALDADPVEHTDAYTFAGIQKSYTAPGTEYITPYDEGGFTFLFNSTYHMQNERGVTMKLEDFLKATVQDQFNHKLGLFSIDWAMYNANYDFLIYNALLFQYMPNGELVTQLKTESFRVKPEMNQLIPLFFFMCFYLYFTVKTFQDLWATFKESTGGRNQQNPFGKQQDDDRSFFLKFINFIGIDEQQLVGQNIVVRVVLCSYMVVKKIVVQTINLARAIIIYSLANMFNLFEMLNTIFTSAVVIVFITMLPILYGDTLSTPKPQLLYDVNRVAFLSEQITFFMAMSVYCLCFRLLKLPQFSLAANMPFATLIKGRKDISNILIILIIFTVANALAAFIVFCPQMKEFSTLNSSIYVLLKLYLGDFQPVAGMHSYAPGFTTLYLFLMMSLYTIFLTQMFLGIIVGHFEDEWNLVKKIQSGDKNKQSFNMVAVIWRILQNYFEERMEQQQALERLEAEEDDGSAKKKCPCTWGSLNPSGMFERIVIYCMTKCCTKCCRKKRQDKNDNIWDPNEDKDDGAQTTTVETQAATKSSKTSKKDGEADYKLPCNIETQEWGNPSLLKFSEEFREHSGVKQYMDWFDGDALDTYEKDFDRWEYNKREFKGAFERIGDAEIKGMRLKLPRDIQGILELEKHWNEEVDEYEKANSNFWMYHLEKQVLMLTKKELSIYNFKSMDCFFKQNLLNKGNDKFEFESELTDKQKEIFYMNEEEQLQFFESRDETCEDKYLAWKAIDQVFRYSQQMEVFKRAETEKIEYLRTAQPGKEERDRKQRHSNLMTILISQIERPIEESVENYLLENFVVTKISKLGRNPLKFAEIKKSTWRNKKYHRVHAMLQKVWRDHLTNYEKFEFWFKHFNTLERVRLWNQLVFTRQWFRRVVFFSRRQKGYKEAIVKLDKIQRNQKENDKKKEERAAKKAAEGEDDDDDDEDDAGPKKEDLKFYRGFHRRDINDMLKEYAIKMYKKGVRNEELLLIKVKPDVDDIVDREFVGGVTSFFNKDKKGEDKAIAAKIESRLELDEKQELQRARQIFTPDQMQKTWAQFFSGRYVVLPGKKKNKNVNKAEDGADADQEIFRLLDERDERKAQVRMGNNSWDKYNTNVLQKYDEIRTMDRYEQIHYFFQAMIEHNSKTLKSCEALQKVKKAADKVVTELKDGEGAANADADAGNEEEEVEEERPESVGGDDDDEDGEGDGHRSEKAKHMKKFKLFEDVLKLVIEEEERLPLWMLMSKEEKLDMLAHQCIDAEAQIMGFLIEFEFGAENNFEVEGKNLQLDNLLENSLNQMIFQKYLAYCRLQASFYARKFTKDLIAKTQEDSIKLYNYAEYLYDLNQALKKKEDENSRRIDDSRKKNDRVERLLRKVAMIMMDNKKGEREADEGLAALTMKFFFEVKPDEIDKGKTPGGGRKM